jgi:uncharacterized membrane protein YgcG
MDELQRLVAANRGLLSSRLGGQGDTPLITAAGLGNLRMVTYLLDQGADIEGEGLHDRRALAWASCLGRLPVVQLLLDRGADAGALWMNRTALILATQHSHTGVVGALLRVPACDVDHRDHWSTTALWWACKRGQHDIAKMLLEAGADHTITDRDGLTPLQTAEAHQRTSCVELLRVGSGFRWGLVPLTDTAFTHECRRAPSSRLCLSLCPTSAHHNAPQESARAFMLFKARRLGDGVRGASRRACPLAFLAPRTDGGAALPSVQVPCEARAEGAGGEGAGEGGEGGGGIGGGGEGGGGGGDSGPLADVVRYCLAGMRAEVFVDWLELLEPRARAPLTLPHIAGLL